MSECDNCNYKARTQKYGEYKFCRVCANTWLSRATTAPEQVDDVKLFKSIGWIANEILSKIEQINK